MKVKLGSGERKASYHTIKLASLGFTVGKWHPSSSTF